VTESHGITSKELNVVNKGKVFKKKITVENISEKTKRSKITDYIAKQNSRHSYIDKAHVEPLHLKKKAWQYFFQAVLTEAIRKSKLPANYSFQSSQPRALLHGCKGQDQTPHKLDQTVVQ